MEKGVSKDTSFFMGNILLYERMKVCEFPIEEKHFMRILTDAKKDTYKFGIRMYHWKKELF